MLWTDVSVGQLGFATVGDLLVDDFFNAGSDLSAIQIDGFVQQSGSFPGGLDGALVGNPMFTGSVDTAASETHPALQMYPWVQAHSGTGPGGPHLVRLDSDNESCPDYQYPEL
ncbi:MAG: hypothetical protein MHM6MM_008432 [Cercozoa sp. M6MM]